MKSTAMLCAVIGAVCLPACSRHDVNLGGTFRTVVDMPPHPIQALDILFVVDNSGSMRPHQQALIDSASSSLFAQLEDDTGRLPDLHVGVVSTDLGAGNYQIAGCTGGDGGYLRGPTNRPACAAAAINGQFLVDEAGGAGGRTRNYSGSIGNAFACLADLGTNGCGFEQPLQSARLALDGRNPGFLRDDAMLLVVILTDEDDCSASDTTLYDVSQTSWADPLGPLSSFRCFDFGVRCDPDDPRTLGSKTGCESREDSDYLVPVHDFINFLTGLKSDPTKVMVGGIFGDAAPVTVLQSQHDQDLELADVCGGSPPPPCPTPDAGVAPDAAPADAGPPAPRADAAPPTCPQWGPVSPGVRLQAVAAGFPARYDFESICQVDFSALLSRIAHATAGVMQASPCVLGQVADVDPDTAGLQPVCRAYDVVAPRTPDEKRTALPACDDSGSKSCFRVVTDRTVCTDSDTGLAVQVERAGPPPDGTHVVLQCQ